MVRDMIAWSLGGAILVCLVASLATDLASRIIPNRLVLLVLCFGVALRSMAGAGPLLVSVAMAALVLVVLGIVASHDLMGWGDVKLIAAATFAVAADRVLPLMLHIALAGGVLAVLYLALRFGLRRRSRLPPRASASRTSSDAAGATAFGRMARREGSRILADEPMPYAFAVFGGTAFGLVGELVAIR